MKAQANSLGTIFGTSHICEQRGPRRACTFLHYRVPKTTKEKIVADGNFVAGRLRDVLFAC